MNCDAELYARITETEKRLAALESALAAAERLAQTPASSMPDAIEQSEVVPQWRRMVDEQHQDLADLRADGRYEALSDVLECLSVHASAQSQPHDRALALARVVAVCEQEVGNGWQADPDRVYPTTWTIGWLMLPLSSNQWTLVADRAAAWLRSLCEDGAA